VYQEKQLMIASEVMQNDFETIEHAIAHYLNHDLATMRAMDYKQFYRDYVRAWRMQESEKAQIEKLKQKSGSDGNN
jgi:hypothetical protein